MTLALVLAAIALAGLLMLVGYAIWLAHKTSDLLAELKVLAQRGGELGQVVGRIELWDRPGESSIGTGEVVAGPGPGAVRHTGTAGADPAPGADPDDDPPPS